MIVMVYRKRYVKARVKVDRDTLIDMIRNLRRIRGRHRECPLCSALWIVLGTRERKPCTSCTSGWRRHIRRTVAAILRG